MGAAEAAMFERLAMCSHALLCSRTIFSPDKNSQIKTAENLNNTHQQKMIL